MLLFDALLLATLIGSYLPASTLVHLSEVLISEHREQSLPMSAVHVKCRPLRRVQLRDVRLYLIENTGGNPTVQVAGPTLILFAGSEFGPDGFPIGLKL